MKNIIVLFILTLLATSSFAQNTLQGWDKAKFGMTIDQLREAYPEANEIEKEVVGNLYYNLILKDYEIMKVKFDVRFMLDKSTNQLDRINIVYTLTDLLSDMELGTKVQQMLALYVQNKLEFGPGKEGGNDIQKNTEWFFDDGRLIRASYIHYEDFDMYSAGCYFLSKDDADEE